MPKALQCIRVLGAKKTLAAGVLVPATGKGMGKGGRKQGRRDVYLSLAMHDFVARFGLYDQAEGMTEVNFSSEPFLPS